MPQPEPAKAEDDEEGAIERRFAELMRRFWRPVETTETPDERIMP